LNAIPYERCIFHMNHRYFKAWFSLKI